MKVHQPGGHLMRERGASVDDWSWRATARRISTLARLTAPYKLRTALVILVIELLIIGWVRRRYGSRARTELGGEPMHPSATRA